jgi:hypothetical protein
MLTDVCDTPSSKMKYPTDAGKSNPHARRAGNISSRREIAQLNFAHRSETIIGAL